LAPGLPGVDIETYGYDFGFEPEKEPVETGHQNDSGRSTEVAPESEPQREKGSENSTDSRNEQPSVASFEQPGKTQNIASFPSQPHSFENLEESGMSPQIYFPYQQIPPVYLQQQGPHLQNRQDPALKVHGNVELSPAVLPHLHQSHFPPNPFFSGLYPGSPHHPFGDQGQFPYNPLPSDPAISDLRVARLYTMEPPPLPYAFHPQQHQAPIGHGPQHVEQNNNRNSPPITGPAQFSNSTPSSSSNEGSKFSQSQASHEMNGIHNSGGMMAHSHEGPSHQPAPQLGQHHQPFPQYFFTQYIPGQYPIPVPVRSPQYYGHKAHAPPQAYPPAVIDMHSPHMAHQPQFFQPEKNAQRPSQVIYGHQNDSQDIPFEKPQSQSAPQTSQQQQSHLQGDMLKGQAPFPVLNTGYNYPHLHPYAGQPQN
jgi:hypothetical protein